MQPNFSVSYMKNLLTEAKIPHDHCLEKIELMDLIQKNHLLNSILHEETVTVYYKYKKLKKTSVPKGSSIEDFKNMLIRLGIVQTGTTSDISIKSSLWTVEEDFCFEKDTESEHPLIVSIRKEKLPDGKGRT